MGLPLPPSWINEQRALIVLSLFVSILAALPLPGFLKSRNVGCSLFAVWTVLLCFTTFINDVIWKDTARNLAPTWCDIHVRISYSGSMGILSAGLVIARRVSLVATSSVAYLTSQDKTRAMLVDLAIGLLPPLAQIIEYWFMAGHRFDIMEGLGCYPAIPLSILNLTLTWVPNVSIALLATFYCLRTLYALLRRHRHVKQVVAMSNIDLQLFYRLLALACVELGCMLPLVIYTLVLNLRVSPGYYPWRGFADLHYGFDRVDQVPYGLWLGNCTFFTLTEWYQIGCGIVFFLLLGLTRDARSRYAKMLGLSRLFPVSQTGNRQRHGGLWLCAGRKPPQNTPLDTNDQVHFSNTSVDSNQSLTFYDKTEGIV